jgi:hypothetical protein
MDGTNIHDEDRNDWQQCEWHPWREGWHVEIQEQDLGKELKVEVVGQEGYPHIVEEDDSFFEDDRTVLGLVHVEGEIV